MSSESESLLHSNTRKKAKKHATFCIFSTSDDYKRETLDIPLSSGSYEKVESCEADGLHVVQAAVFVQDAISYRTVHHRVDPKSLRIYTIYYSRLIQWYLLFVIFANLSLAFLEKPSSVSWSADARFGWKRYEFPCGVLEVIELICLLTFLADFLIKRYLFGYECYTKRSWNVVYIIAVIISLIDWMVTVGFCCQEEIRVRRIIRPIFLIQYSSMMRRTINAIRRTIPEILSVLFLLTLHLFCFAVFGMLLFPKTQPKYVMETYNTTTGNVSEFVKMQVVPAADREGVEYFNDLADSLRNLLVLITTANNPDVTMPAYMTNRLYQIYFVIFECLGLYFFLNMLLAVVYNNFRGYLVSSLQQRFYRRRVGIRAAFEVLNWAETSRHIPRDCVCNSAVRKLLTKVHAPKQDILIMQEIIDNTTTKFMNAQQFQDMFEILSQEKTFQKPQVRRETHPVLLSLQKIIRHPCFNYFGDVVASANVMVIAAELVIQYMTALTSRTSILATCNFFFILYYVVELIAKVWAAGWARFKAGKANIFIGMVTIILLLSEIIRMSLCGSPFEHQSLVKLQNSTVMGTSFTMWNLMRIINMLIIFRLFRLVLNIKALSLIAGTLFDLLGQLRPFAGVLMAAYYIFAIIGMWSFQNVIEPETVIINSTRKNWACGTYQQLEYYANNFDDFAASLVVLWDVMVVNNWMIFLEAYAKTVNRWAQLYFVAWYLVSVVIGINLFVAVVLEAFQIQWEKKHSKIVIRDNTEQRTLTKDRSFIESDSGGEVPTVEFHEIFSASVQEPTEAQLRCELNRHPYMMFDVLRYNTFYQS